MNVFTIGYEGLEPDSFVAYLKYWKIDAIADVRDLPLSRKKGFSKSPLIGLLSKHNIEYMSCKDLGAPKELREELHLSGNYNRFFEKYRKKISNSGQSLENLHKILSEGKKIALLCFERDPEKCHRKIIAEELKKIDGNGLSIKHIKPIG